MSIKMNNLLVSTYVDVENQRDFLVVHNAFFFLARSVMSTCVYITNSSENNDDNNKNQIFERKRFADKFVCLFYYFLIFFLIISKTRSLRSACSRTHFGDDENLASQCRPMNSHTRYDIRVCQRVMQVRKNRPININFTP